MPDLTIEYSWRSPEYPWIVAETFAVYITGLHCERCGTHTDLGYISPDDPDWRVESLAFARKHSTCKEVINVDTK